MATKTHPDEAEHNGQGRRVLLIGLLEQVALYLMSEFLITRQSILLTHVLGSRLTREEFQLVDSGPVIRLEGGRIMCQQLRDISLWLKRKAFVRRRSDDLSQSHYLRNKRTSSYCTSMRVPTMKLEGWEDRIARDWPFSRN